MHTRHKDYSKSNQKPNPTDKPTIPAQSMSKVTSSMTESDEKISKINLSNQVDSKTNSDKQAMSDDEVGMLKEDIGKEEKKAEVEKKKVDPNMNEEVVKNVNPNRNEDPVVRPIKAVKKKVITLKDDDGKDIGTVELDKVRKKRKYVATLDRWTHGVTPTLIPFSALTHGMHIPPTHPHNIYFIIYKCNIKCKFQAL